MSESTALITNDAVVFGILLLMLGLVFKTSQSERKIFRAFYRYVPVLLLCYFLPSLLNTFNIVDGDASKLYFISSRFLLPGMSARRRVGLCLAFDGFMSRYWSTAFGNADPSWLAPHAWLLSRDMEPRGWEQSSYRAWTKAILPCMPSGSPGRGSNRP